MRRSPSDSSTQDVTVIRSKRRSWYEAFQTLVAWLVIFASLVGLISGGTLAGVALGLACLVGLADGVRRSFAIRARVTESGIAVQNYWRRYETSWSQVRRVRKGYLTMGVVPQRVIAVDTADGAAIKIQGSPVWGDEFDATLARLALYAVADEDARSSLP